MTHGCTAHTGPWRRGPICRSAMTASASSTWGEQNDRAAHHSSPITHRPSPITHHSPPITQASGQRHRGTAQHSTPWHTHGSPHHSAMRELSRPSESSGASSPGPLGAVAGDLLFGVCSGALSRHPAVTVRHARRAATTGTGLCTARRQHRSVERSMGPGKPPRGPGLRALPGSRTYSSTSARPAVRIDPGARARCRVGEHRRDEWG